MTSSGVAPARRLVIFDFDGTLADTFSCFTKAFDEAADKFNFMRLDRAQAHSLRQLGARQIMAHHQVPLWKVPAIANHMRRSMGREIDNVRLFPGMEAVLHELAGQGTMLAIVTSNSRANVLTVLGPLAGLFSHLECGASLFGKVPKLRKILSASRTAADAAILVGDEIRDAHAAKEAGIAFGAVAWGFTDIDALRASGAQQVFHQVADIPGHFDTRPS